MLEETNKEEISKKFFGSKQNIATIAVITVDTYKGKNFETTFVVHRVPFCKLSYSMLYSTYLLAKVHPSICEYWFGTENIDLRNYILGAMDTAR